MKDVYTVLSMLASAEPKKYQPAEKHQKLAAALEYMTQNYNMKIKVASFKQPLFFYFLVIIQELNQNSNALFLIKQDGKYGYVNKNGDLIVNPIYVGECTSTLSPFEQMTFKVSFNAGIIVES